MIFNDILKYSRRLVKTTEVTSSPYEVKSTDERIEFNSPGNLIIVTLPEITNSFKNRDSITFSVINGTKVEFRGINGNYDDEYFQIGNDPIDETVKIYASNDGKWRRDGYGLPEQQAYYSSLSTGAIEYGEDGQDPSILLTDNGNETLNVNFGGKYRIVDRVNPDNTTPVSNNRPFKLRSRRLEWQAESNIDHSSLSTDGVKLIVVDENQNISIVDSPNGTFLQPVFSNNGSVNNNTHIQLGGFEKQAGVTSNLDSIIIANNNPYNWLFNIARTMGVINSIENPIKITPISSTIQFSYNNGLSFTGAPGQWLQSGGLASNYAESIASSPVTIITVNRLGNGSIVSISNSANVTQYESAPGVFSSIGNNRAANRFYQGAIPFITELLGQDTYGGGSALQLAQVAEDDNIDIPGLTSLLVKLTKMSVLQNSTDLADPLQALFKNIKQFN